LHLTDLSPEAPIVTTTGGQVQGRIVVRRLTDKFLSYRGIPYAEPPVGPLRWKNPVPHRGWSGVRDGSKYADHCPNKGVLDIGPVSKSLIDDERDCSV
jgi:bile salt-stimulated lipase